MIRNIKSIKDLKVTASPRYDKAPEGRAICPTCEGVSLVLFNDKYLDRCPDCAAGTVATCPVCGEILGRSSWRCRKQECIDTLDKSERKKWFEKAEKVTLEQAKGRFDYLYDDHLNEYICIDDLEDHIENYIIERAEPPKYLVGTDKAWMEIDATDILENACSMLHEEVYDSLYGIDDLQDALDIFCERNRQNTTTYTANNVAVMIDDLVEKLLKEVRDEC